MRLTILIISLITFVSNYPINSCMASDFKNAGDSLNITFEKDKFTNITSAATEAFVLTTKFKKLGITCLGSFLCYDVDRKEIKLRIHTSTDPDVASMDWLDMKTVYMIIDSLVFTLTPEQPTYRRKSSGTFMDYVLYFEAIEMPLSSEFMNSMTKTKKYVETRIQCQEYRLEFTIPPGIGKNLSDFILKIKNY